MQYIPRAQHCRLTPKRTTRKAFPKPFHRPISSLVPCDMVRTKYVDRCPSPYFPCKPGYPLAFRRPTSYEGALHSRCNLFRNAPPGLCCPHHTAYTSECVRDSHKTPKQPFHPRGIEYPKRQDSTTSRSVNLQRDSRGLSRSRHWYEAFLPYPIRRQ